MMAERPKKKNNKNTRVQSAALFGLKYSNDPAVLVLGSGGDKKKNEKMKKHTIVYYETLHGTYIKLIGRHRQNTARIFL